MLHHPTSRSLAEGRPPAEPTHQVKCRIRESTYQRLLAESKKRRTTPSTLLKEWLEKAGPEGKQLVEAYQKMTP